MTETLDLLNNSLNSGNYVPSEIVQAYGIAGPRDIVFDPQDGYFFVACLGGPVAVFEMNGTLVTLIPTGGPVGSVAYNPVRNEVYAMHYDSESVVTISGSNLSVVGSIRVGTNPWGAGFDPWNGDVYVANSGSDNLTIINATSDRPIGAVPVGSSPHYVEAPGSGRYLFVSDYASNNVSRVDSNTNRVVGSTGTGSGPGGMAYDSSRNRLYVVNSGSDNVTVLNASSGALAFSVSVGVCPWGAAYNVRNREIYVTDTTCSFPGGKVTVIAGATGSVVATLSVQNYPFAVAFDPTGEYAYVTNEFSLNMTVLNTTTRRIVDVVGVGPLPSGLAYDTSNADMYVTEWGGNSVTVVNGTTGSVIGQVAVGWAPSGIAYATKEKDLFIANAGSNNVSVIDGRSNRLLGSIPVGDRPEAVAYDSANDRILVANCLSGNLSVIDAGSRTVVASISTGRCPAAIAYDQRNGELYVALQPNPWGANEGVYQNLTVLNGTDYHVVRTVAIGEQPTGVAYDVAADRIYVVNSFFRPNVTIIDPADNSVEGVIALNGTPWGIAYDSANGELFVTIGSGLMVIDGEDETPLGTVSVGNWAVAVAVDSANGKVFVADQYSNTVTIIDPTVYHYKVTFQQLGLPTGTDWTLLVNGIVYDSTTRYLNLSEVNGIYSYSVEVIPGYSATPRSGSVSVFSANARVQIQFSLVMYSIAFTEVGLPSATTWSVILSGTTAFSTSGIVQFTEPNGTYSYIVGSVKDYSASPTVGSVAMNGVNRTVVVTFVQTPLNQTAPLATRTWANLTVRGGGERFCIDRTGRAGGYPAWEDLSFTARASNGTPPYTFRWTFGDGSPNATGAQVSHNFTGYGVRLVRVTTDDSVGAVNTTEVAVSFLPPPDPILMCPTNSTATFLGLAAAEGYAVLVGVVASVAAAAITVFIRRRREDNILGESATVQSPPNGGTRPGRPADRRSGKGRLT